MIDSGRILPLKILVTEVKKAEKVGNIFIPETTKPKSIVGEVVLVGDSTPNMQMVCKVGDRVLHSPHSFVEVEIEGSPYRLLNMADVLFIY